MQRCPLHGEKCTMARFLSLLRLSAQKSKMTVLRGVGTWGSACATPRCSLTGVTLFARERIYNRPRFVLRPLLLHASIGFRGRGVVVFLLEDNLPGGTVDRDPLASGDAFGSLWYADDSRDTVLSGHDCAV